MTKAREVHMMSKEPKHQPKNEKIGKIIYSDLF